MGLPRLARLKVDTECRRAVLEIRRRGRQDQASRWSSKRHTCGAPGCEPLLTHLLRFGPLHRAAICLCSQKQLLWLETESPWQDILEQAYTGGRVLSPQWDLHRGYTALALLSACPNWQDLTAIPLICTGYHRCPIVYVRSCSCVGSAK